MRAAGAKAAAVAVPIVIRLVGESHADSDAKGALAAQSESIEALRTPTTGVLVVTNKRTRRHGDTGTGNVSVDFVSLYPVGGFGTQEQAVGAHESHGSLWQDVQNTSYSSTYTWYPPLTTPRD